MSNNFVKGSFVQFSGENTRVIDTSALVKKRMESFSSVFREQNDQTEEKSEEEAGSEEFKPGGIAELFEDRTPEQEEAPVTLDPDEIRAECDEMIRQANAEADHLRAEAHADVENIRNDAKTMGYQEGYAQGREDGAREYDIQLTALNEERARLHEEYEALLSDLEPRMVEAVSEVYEHVFGCNFYNRRDVMVCLLNRALQTMATDSQVIIHVSSEDYDMLVGMKNSIMEKVALANFPEIRQREDFVPGQAKIETAYGIIDCSIDTELMELSRTLKLISFEGHS